MSKAFRTPDYLEHMSEAIARISSYLQGMDWPAFSANRLAQDATIRNLEIIGEAARNVLRVDPNFAERYPDFPLGRAIGMRNSLAHGYFDVKLELVWKTVQEDLPDFARKVGDALSKLRTQ
jgi:uncharacterized protein with HEPN domain